MKKWLNRKINIQYYHLVRTALKKVKEVWKSRSLPLFCCSCTQAIISRYYFDITIGFSLPVKTLKVCLGYPDMLGLWVLEAYFARFYHWKNIKHIFQKKGKESGVFLLYSMIDCRKFVIVLSMKLWSTSKYLKIQNTLTITCHQSTETQSIMR